MKRRSLILPLALLAFACEEEPKDSPNASAASAASEAAPAPPSTPEQAPEPKPEKPPEAVAAQHVLIAYRGAKNAPKEVKRSKKEARALAEEIAKKAKDGADFTGLVKEHSEDPGTKDRLGSLGKFTPDKMVKPFSDAAFALKVDEVSDVVETEFGFHVIKRNQ
jgi:parvulin-like peptidyl-prolyl isomerase